LPRLGGARWPVARGLRSQRRIEGGCAARLRCLARRHDLARSRAQGGSIAGSRLRWNPTISPTLTGPGKLSTESAKLTATSCMSTAFATRD